MNESFFELRTGLHFEHRPGMCNFSVVGRMANTEQRKLYVKHDTGFDERNTIAQAFCTIFPDIDAKVGGETGIDIAPKGSDKSQILIDFKEEDTIHFFGDAMNTHGNDYPLKQVIIDQERGLCYAVSNWKDTKNILYERTLGRKISS